MKQPFLVNPRGRKRKVARKTSRRRTTARRKGVPAWVRARGFSSWGTYMASIRPNKKGGTVKRRRRKARASVARKTVRRRRRTVAARARTAAPRRRRRSYRRNPLGLRNLPSMIQTGAIAAVGVLAGKAGARVGRSALKIEGGTPVGYATEVAIGIAGGILLERVNRNLATNFLTGAFVSVGESLAKRVNIPIVSAALGDEGEGVLNLVGGDDDLSGYLTDGTMGAYELGAYERAEA